MTQDNMKESQSLDSKYLLLVFDVLISKGVLVYDKNYLERRKFIVEKNTPLFQMKEKEILIYEKKNKDFHLRVKEAFEIERNSLYNTDGLIFTPIESPYITEGQKLVENQKFVRKNFKRNLGFYKDVCKYKRPEDLTIDFLVKNGKPYFNDKNSEKLFAGSFNYPFKYYNYEIPEGSEYEGKIVEFKPTFVDDNEINVIYKPLRIRQDKFVSNKLSTIINLWDLVHNPITPETLKGENITMMRKYNNKIKSKLIEGLSGYVLDIGGGNGGDLPKYKNNHKLDKILCVEPNKDFNKEFERRFDKLKLDKNNFKLLSTGGEDSIKITKCARKFFPISMENKDFNVVFMLSLSFFWKTKKFLQRLTNTINEIKSMYYERGGNKDFNVCFFTIIGDRVKNLFSLEGKEVKLNTILLRKISNEEYYIDITDSVTVFSQLEYFVNLQEMWNLINVKSLSEATPKPYFPSDYILSENEITYSKLFSYGMATLNKEITENFTKPRLFVDDTKGTSTQYGPISKGDDKEEKLEKISNNCYRVATINQDHSLYHSILKLLDNSYRKSNVYERINKAVDLKEKLKGANNNLNIISRKLNKGIVVYNTSFQEQIYGKDMTKFIFLFKNLDDSFEPIICKESGQNKYIFNKNNLN